MDDYDIKLIAELRRNARVSLSDLEPVIGLSRSTIRTRLAKLQSDGVIVGYTVTLAQDVQDHSLRGLMMLGIQGRGTDRITRALSGISAVRAIHSTIGKWDLIVELGADTVEALDTVLADIRKLEGVSTSETNLMLTTRLATKR